MSEAVTEANTLTRQLWHIAGTGDLEQLDELVGQGVDVNAADRTGVTALMRAAYHGQLGMVRALIGYGADPTAKDRSGLTGLIMAEHGGHEEIVEALRRFDAQGKTEVARKPRLVGSVTEEDVDLATDYEDSTIGETSQTARILHEPMEIWELVHTTQTEPYSPSAGAGRVFPRKILALGLSVLILVAVTVFGFLALRGAGTATDDTAEKQRNATEASSSNQPLFASTPRTNLPNRATRSSNEPAKLKPEGELTGANSDDVGPTVTLSARSSMKKPSANQRAKGTKVGAASLKQNRNATRATRLDREQETNKSAKKEPAPPVSDPVKPSTTQKPKVIPWP